VEIVANEMMMLGERRDHNNTHTASETASEENSAAPNEDEFPF
jgi:hypothetical protein